MERQHFKTFESLEDDIARNEKIGRIFNYLKNTFIVVAGVGAAYLSHGLIDSIEEQDFQKTEVVLGGVVLGFGLMEAYGTNLISKATYKFAEDDSVLLNKAKKSQAEAQKRAWKDMTLQLKKGGYF